MSAIDFANSYMHWVGENQRDVTRIPIEAACTLYRFSTGKSEAYYLVAPCRGEYMYEDGALFKMPSFDWRAVYSVDDQLIFRKHWVSERDNRSWSDNSRYTDFRLDISTFEKTRSITRNDEIAGPMRGNVPLVARTELRDEGSGLVALLEYPVKTISLPVLKEPTRFQIDTGPVIIPDFESRAERPIERFEIAHVIYNVFDKAEFILRRPTPVADGGTSPHFVTDYSEVRVYPARNEILCPV